LRSFSKNSHRSEAMGGSVSSREKISNLFMVRSSRVAADTGIASSSYSGWTGVLTNDCSSYWAKRKTVTLVDPVSGDTLASTVIKAKHILLQCYIPVSNKLVVQISQRHFSERYLMIWDLATGKWNKLLKLNENHTSPRVISDITGSKLLVVSFNEFVLWNIHSNILILSLFTIQGFSAQACFGRDNRIVIMDCERTINVWDTSTIQKLQSFDSRSSTCLTYESSMISTRDGRLCAQYTGTDAAVWDIDSGNNLFFIERPDIRSAGFVSEETIILVFKTGLTAWKICDGSVVFSVEYHRRVSLWLSAFNHVQDTIGVVSLPDHDLIEIDLVTGKEIKRSEAKIYAGMRTLVATPVNCVVLL
jgi:WD40 repeat protein